jgi:translocation and assembly module TamB
MNLHVRTSTGSLESLGLTPWVDEATGGLEAELRIRGTPQSPLLWGWARTADGRIRPAGREEVLENVRVGLRFEGNLVTIEEARATMGGGAVTATGTYRLHAGETETYEVLIHADQAVVRGGGVYAARASGDLRVVPVRAEDGAVYPFATGTLLVQRAEYAGTLKPQDIAQFTRPSVLYDVTITAPGKVFIINEEANAELAGEVTVRQTPTRRIVLGELEIVRGWYTVFLERFRITEGRLWWTDPETLLPEMDVTAETLQGGYLITVNVTGRADAPALTFAAQSLEGGPVDLSQDDIVLLLAQGALGLAGTLPGGEDVSGNRRALEEGLSVGTSLLGGPIERELTRRLGIDEFQLSTGAGAGEDLGAQVSLRKWVLPQLSFIVRQGLGRTFDQDLAVEYRLRRSLLVRGGMRNQQEGPSSTVNQVYNLDLRLRLEY